MQSLIRSKSAGVTGGRGTAGAGPGRDLLYFSELFGGAGASVFSCVPLGTESCTFSELFNGAGAWI